MQTSIRTIFKQVRPDKTLTSDGIHCIADHIEKLLQRFVSGETHLSLFSIKEKMEKLVHPSQIPHVEKEIDKTFSHYYKKGIAGENVDFSVQAIKKFIKNDVDTFCYTDLLYIAACIDYLCSEICELAGKDANDDQKVRVTAEHVNSAISNDEALSYTFKYRSSKKSKKSARKSTKRSRK